jgi:hypothetical protein
MLDLDHAQDVAEKVKALLRGGGEDLHVSEVGDVTADGLAHGALVRHDLLATSFAGRRQRPGDL